MKLELVTVPSFWGTEMKQKHYRLHEGNKKLVVLFPGQNYPCHKPVLHFAGTCAMQNGYDVLMLEYGYQAARTELRRSEVPTVAEESYESVKPIVGQYEQIVWISKSLGTVIAGSVHEKLGVPVKHIFLTPVPETVPYINKFSGVVVYGTKDPAFGEEQEKQIQAENRMIRIADANHALETDDVEKSIEILKQLAKVYEDVLNS